MMPIVGGAFKTVSQGLERRMEEMEISEKKRVLLLILDASLLNTQQYKVRIKGKVEQSSERSGTLLYTPV